MLREGTGHGSSHFLLCLPEVTPARGQASRNKCPFNPPEKQSSLQLQHSLLLPPCRSQTEGQGDTEVTRGQEAQCSSQGRGMRLLEWGSLILHSAVMRAGAAEPADAPFPVLPNPSGCFEGKCQVLSLKKGWPEGWKQGKRQGNQMLFLSAFWLQEISRQEEQPAGQLRANVSSGGLQSTDHLPC